MKRGSSIILGLLALAACDDSTSDQLLEPVPPSFAQVLASIDGDCPPCGERFPTPDELTDIENALDKMDSCQDIQSALSTTPIYIFTDDVAADTAGGVHVLYDNGETEIYISEDVWDLSGGQFEAELFNKLKHEGTHEVLWRDAESTEDWLSSDYHGDAFLSKFETCYSS